MPFSRTETLQTPYSNLATGTTSAGRYQVIEELGKGGMGHVYKVYDQDIEEKVALKLLNPEVASDEEIIKRFWNELKLARTISHKNVCRMYDLGQQDGTNFITMEYVPGENLASFIRRSGRLTVGKAAALALQICEGLAEAHRLGVVHRDLKSPNIMIDHEGNVRIMDFGIARSLNARGPASSRLLDQMFQIPRFLRPAGGPFVFLALAVSVPFLRGLFRFGTVPAWEWAAVFAAGLVSIQISASVKTRCARRLPGTAVGGE